MDHMNIKELRKMWYEDQTGGAVRVSAATPNIIRMDHPMIKSYLDMIQRKEASEVIFEGYLWNAGPRNWPCRFVVMSCEGGSWTFQSDGYLDRKVLSELCSVSPTNIRSVTNLSIRQHYTVH
jgi:hypothetical protein